MTTLDLQIDQDTAQLLFLLVGRNPLPNAVAAILLAGRQSTIALIHSEDSFAVAQRLQTWLQRHGLTETRLSQVSESEPSSIFQSVLSELTFGTVKSVALHYTGGTKTMSVHAYRAIEQWARNRNIKPVFSYLNPRRLELVFDPYDPASGEKEVTKQVGLAVEMALTDLLELHGWSLKNDPNITPTLPELARALSKVCADPESFRDWKKWIEGELRANCHKPDKDQWKTNSQIPETLPLPASSDGSPIQDAVAEFRSHALLQSGDLMLRQPAFNYEAKRFCQWLDGKWLEHYVLNELQMLPDALQLRELRQNVETNEVEFDVDVVALRGYQLFAISCSTDERKGLLKSKLFEAFVRAKQLGGDESRVALVCCSSDPQKIEQEMRRDVDPEGRIKVFGKSELADLRTCLERWIREQSKGA